MKSNAKNKAPPATRKPALAAERVPLADLKMHLSRYVREVQQGGRAIIITQHGRDTAVLAPLKATTAEPVPPLPMRPALDPRRLGKVINPEPKGRGITATDIQGAIDEDREDRF